MSSKYTFTPDPSFHQSYKTWLSRVQEAIHIAVPLTTRRPRINPWITKEIRALIVRRNLAQKEGRHAECTALSAEIKHEINKTKRAIFEERITNHLDNIWPLVKQLDNSSRPNRASPIYTTSGNTLTSDKDIAESFASTYACRSMNHPLNNQDRTEVLHPAIAAVSTLAVEGPAPPEITADELKTHIDLLNPTGATGADNIHNLVLKHLPTHHLNQLLLFINHSIASGEVPVSWRNAIIIPLPKPGKPLTSTSSYRPVALTSCIAKLTERIISRRIQPVVTSSLHPSQCGFRSNRSTDDHLAWLSQSILDGFEKRERTVAAFIDLSSAFDVAWKHAIILRLSQLDIPNHFTRWIASFLSDRTCKVRFNGTLSSSHHFHQGVPQGCVLSPTLFSVLIDDLPRSCATEGVHFALYADDIAVWASHPDKKIAASLVESAVQKIFSWCAKWKLLPNATKSVTSFFSADSHEAKFTPVIHPIAGNTSTLPFDPHPKFLGLTFDRLLHFGKHADLLKTKMTSRLNAIKAIAARSWGATAKVIRQAYLGYVSSVASYGSATWATTAAPSHLKRVESANCAGARLISGCCAGTPQGILRHEAQISSMQDIGNASASRLREKILRIPDHPARSICTPTNREITHPDTPHRHTSRTNYFRIAGLRLATATGFEKLPRKQLDSALPPLHGLSHVAFLHSTTASKSDSEVTRSSEAQARIDALTLTPHIIWTDGSASEGFRDGGAGCFFAHDPLRNITIPAGHFTSSFQAEVTAIDAALTSIINNPPDNFLHLRICTDSQSAIKAIQNATCPNPLIKKIRGSLKLVPSCDIIFVPGHCNIPGNEEADRLAGIAAKLDQSQTAIDFSAATTASKRLLKSATLRKLQDPHQHRHSYLPTLGNRNPLEIHNILPRRDAVSIAQLRSGDSPLLATYRHRIGLEGSATCHLCHSAIGDLDHHLSHCQASLHLRLAKFLSWTIPLLLSPPTPLILSPSYPPPSS